MPFGLILRVVGYDPLKKRKKVKSNWNDVDIGCFDMDRMTHQS
jgi:hypothetical protein